MALKLMMMLIIKTHFKATNGKGNEKWQTIIRNSFNMCSTEIHQIKLSLIVKSK